MKNKSQTTKTLSSMRSKKIQDLLAIAVSTMAAIVLLLLASCEKETPLKAAPTISLGTTATSNLKGAEVSTSVTVDAPEGGKTIEILVNGVTDSSLPDVQLNGTTSQILDIVYTIPSTATIGSIINITFKAVDKVNQVSSTATFAVTVSEVPSKQIIDVTGSITTDTHWTADKIYRLNGFVRVGTDAKPGAGGPGVAPVISATATLTIDAGTVIYGKTGTPGGALIIQRGSKIIAIGTSSAPIVFTSENAPGTRQGGDWTGVVICGKATNNLKASASTGLDGVEELEGSYGAFHGGGAAADDADNSGMLQYVRIEFAGYPINPNQEVNGLTLGSVGSGTTIDHIQVSYANDDSYEWFGGTVNCFNIIAYKGIDDDFDTDNGYSGKVQFGLGIRDPLIADQSGSNGFESDNDAAGTANLPFTSAVFSNMTIIGAKETNSTTVNIQFQNAAQIRRNSKQSIINSFFTGYPNGIFLDNALGAPGTISHATTGALVLKNNVLAGVESWGGNGFGTAATTDEITALSLLAAGSNHPNAPRGRVVAGGVGSFSNGAFTLTSELQISASNPMPWFALTNQVKSKWSDVSLGLSASIFDPISGIPTLLPTGTSLTTGADFTGFTGFTTVAYKGAFGSSDWTAGWVNWNPQITDYSK
jgi:hypothetical protein